jgi:hypothetical protein
LDADATDRDTLKRAIYTLIERQRDTNECIDIDNVKSKTFKFDARGDYASLDLDPRRRTGKGSWCVKKSTIQASTKAIGKLDTYTV